MYSAFVKKINTVVHKAVFDRFQLLYFILSHIVQAHFNVH